MSTQAIKDYLVKQIFIEKNVVTYRSLSRQFGIHVNAAKEELATYHEKAPYDSQQSFATYLLTGEVLNPQRRSPAIQGKRDTRNADTDMDVDEEDDGGLDMFVPTQTDRGDEDEEADDDAEEEDEDYEDVTTICVRIVNELDLEDAKTEYRNLSSVHIYSLSPSVIHDASHLCTPTAAIRRTDNTKGAEYAQTVGRIVAPNIHVKPMKAKDLPVAAGPSTSITAEDPASKAVAGRSVNAMAGKTTNSATSTSSVKPEVEKKAPAKKTGKSDFFGGAKKKEQEKAPVVKKEEPVEEKKKSGRMFFGATTSKAKAKEVMKPVAVKEEEEEEPISQPAKPSQRGTKRKSALEFSDSETEEPVKPRKTNARPSTSKVASPASSRAPSVGVSRPPSSAASSRRSSAGRAVTFEREEEEEQEEQKPKAKPKVKKGVVLSDDDEEEEKPLKKASSKKEERMKKARMLEEKEARELMELDDDHVERVSRRAGNRPNPIVDADDEEEEERPAAKKAVKEEDVDISMDVDDEAPPAEGDDDEEVVSKPKQQKRKREKAPLGRNGLKKRKVMKTRKFKGEDGYMQTQDYSDWESVDGDEEEQAEEKKPKAKSKAAPKKASTSKEDADEGSGSSKAPSRAPSVTKKESKPAASKATSKEAKAKPTAAKAKPVPAKGKGQSGIRSFFNVSQK